MKLNMEYKKITKSLCAVFLALGMMVSPFAKPISATETADMETTTAETTTVETIALDELMAYDAEDVDKYNVTIEFGALHFYYDWGEWDTATHSYKADPSSANPAADTVAGAPGWYGFDGQNNLLVIKNQSDDDVLVTVSFDMTNTGSPAYDNSSGEYVALKDVAMTLYGDADFNTPFVGSVSTNTYEIHMEEMSIGDFYLSFSGQPTLTDDSKYLSPVPKVIGFLVVTVACVEP